MSLILASVAQSTLHTLKSDLPHAVLLHGERGVGLLTIAAEIAGPGHELIEPTQRTASSRGIPIEAIRELYVRTRGKTSRQVIIVDDADMMSLPSQHAFLKLLEEPQPNAHFILTSHSPDKLLSTVRSRVQSYNIPRADSQAFDTYLSTLNLDEMKSRQIKFIAEGRPALASRLATNLETLTTLGATMRDAQIYVGQNRYAAYGMARKYSSTASAGLELIEASIIVLKHALKTQPESAVVQRLEKLTQVHANLKANAQTRLQLLSFVL